jgi:hypothetical protein
MTHAQLQDDLNASIDGAQLLTREILGSTIRFLVQCHRFTHEEIQDTVNQLLIEIAQQYPKQTRLRVVAGTHYKR